MVYFYKDLDRRVGVVKNAIQAEIFVFGITSR
jgi:hypothetical protein